MTEFNIIKGKTLVSVDVDENNAKIYFHFNDKSCYKMYMSDDCCNGFWLDDVCGDWGDLIGEPLTEAEEITNADEPEEPDEAQESYTWTFYKLGTIKGCVTLRWFGTSNGYYSESVYFREIKPTGKREGI